jgi:hypothetical protein
MARKRTGLNACGGYKYNGNTYTAQELFDMLKDGELESLVKEGKITINPEDMPLLAEKYQGIEAASTKQPVEPMANKGFKEGDVVHFRFRGQTQTVQSKAKIEQVIEKDGVPAFVKLEGINKQIPITDISTEPFGGVEQAKKAIAKKEEAAPLTKFEKAKERGIAIVNAINATKAKVYSFVDEKILEQSGWTKKSVMDFQKAFNNAFNSDKLGKKKLGKDVQIVLMNNNQMLDWVAENQPQAYKSAVAGKLDIKGVLVNPEGTLVIINVDKASNTTPLHEIAGHIWEMWAKKNAPTLYNAMIKKVGETKYFTMLSKAQDMIAEGKSIPQVMQSLKNTKEFKAVFADKKATEGFLDLMQYVTHGINSNLSRETVDDILRSEIFAKVIETNADILGSHEDKSVMQSFKDFIAELFKKLAEVTGFKSLNYKALGQMDINQFAQAVLSELSKGELSTDIARKIKVAEAGMAKEATESQIIPEATKRGQNVTEEEEFEINQSTSEEENKGIDESEQEESVKEVTIEDVMNEIADSDEPNIYESMDVAEAAKMAMGKIPYVGRLFEYATKTLLKSKDEAKRAEAAELMDNPKVFLNSRLEDLKAAEQTEETTKEIAEIESAIAEIDRINTLVESANKVLTTFGTDGEVVSNVSAYSFIRSTPESILKPLLELVTNTKFFQDAKEVDITTNPADILEGILTQRYTLSKEDRAIMGSIVEGPLKKFWDYHTAKLKSEDEFITSAKLQDLFKKEYNKSVQTSAVKETKRNIKAAKYKITKQAESVFKKVKDLERQLGDTTKNLSPEQKANIRAEINSLLKDFSKFSVASRELDHLAYDSFFYEDMNSEFGIEEFGEEGFYRLLASMPYTRGKYVETTHLVTSYKQTSASGQIVGDNEVISSHNLKSEAGNVLATFEITKNFDTNQGHISFIESDKMFGDPQATKEAFIAATRILQMDGFTPVIDQYLTGQTYDLLKEYAAEGLLVENKLAPKEDPQGLQDEVRFYGVPPFNYDFDGVFTIDPIDAENLPLFSFSAHHGTGVLFNRFDYSFMGTGEGAQAYGWGGYFATKKNIAKQYAKNIYKKNSANTPTMLLNNKIVSYDDIRKGVETGNALFTIINDLIDTKGIEFFNKPYDEQVKEIDELLGKYKQGLDISKIYYNGIDRMVAELKTTINDLYGKISDDELSQIVKKRKLEYQDELYNQINKIIEENPNNEIIKKYNKKADPKHFTSAAWESLIGTELFHGIVEKEIPKLKPLEIFYKNLINGAKQLDRTLVVVDEDKIFNYLNTKNRPVVYDVTLFKGKDPSEYEFMDWHKPVSPSKLEKIYNGLKKLGVKVTEGQDIFTMLGVAPINFSKYGLDINYGGAVYIALDKYFNNQKEASLFLLNNGIDGVSVPNNYLAGNRSENEMNYVVFDENAISIEQAKSLNDNPLPLPLFSFSANEDGTKTMFSFGAPQTNAAIAANPEGALPVQHIDNLGVTPNTAQVPALNAQQQGHINNIANSYRNLNPYTQISFQPFQPENKTILSNVNSFITRQTVASLGLGTEYILAKESMVGYEANQKSELEKETKVALALLSSPKYANEPSMKGMTVEAKLNLINLALSGDPVAFNVLPSDFQPMITGMRNRIDSLSEAMIRSGWLKLSTAEAFDKGLGNHLRRQYKKFTLKEKAWEKFANNLDPAVRDRAVRGFYTWVQEGFYQEPQTMAGYVPLYDRWKEYNRDEKAAYKLETRLNALNSRLALKQQQLPQRQNQQQAQATIAKIQKDIADVTAQLNPLQAKLAAEFPVLDAATYDLAEKGLQDLLDAPETSSSLNPYTGSQIQMATLKKRLTEAEFPEWMRDVYGEIKDPVMNYQMTVSNLVNMTSRMKFLNDVYTLAKGDGFVYNDVQISAKEREQLKKDGWVNIDGTNEGTPQTRFGPFIGTWVKPELYEFAFGTDAEISTIYSVRGWVLIGKTAGNLLFGPIRNFFGNGSFLLVNGSATKFFANIKNGVSKSDFEYMKSLPGKNLGSKFYSFWDTAIDDAEKLGLFQTVNTDWAKETFGKISKDTVLMKAFEKSEAEGWSYFYKNYVCNLGRWVKDGAVQSYIWADILPKLTSFTTSRNHLANKLAVAAGLPSGLSYNTLANPNPAHPLYNEIISKIKPEQMAQINRMAGHQTNMSMVTSDRVAPIVANMPKKTTYKGKSAAGKGAAATKDALTLIFGGDFPRFVAESMRIFLQQLGNVATINKTYESKAFKVFDDEKENSKFLKALNVEQRAHTLAGLIGWSGVMSQVVPYFGGLGASLLAMIGLGGGDDDDENAETNNNQSVQVSTKPGFTTEGFMNKNRNLAAEMYRLYQAKVNGGMSIDEALREVSREFEQNHQLDFKLLGDGKFMRQDVSSIDPFAVFTAIPRSIIYRPERGFYNKLTGGVSSLYDEYLGVEMGVSNVLDLVKNQNPYTGLPIYNEEADFFGKKGAAMLYHSVQTLAPTFITKALKMYEKSQDKVNQRTGEVTEGKPLDKQMLIELQSAAYGRTYYEENPRKLLHNLIKPLYSGKAGAVRQKTYFKDLDILKDVCYKMNRKVQAMRTLGMKEDEIAEVLGDIIREDSIWEAAYYGGTYIDNLQLDEDETWTEIK